MCFGSASPPTPLPSTPMPQEDDEASRRAAALKRNEVLAKSTGRHSNTLGMTGTMGYAPAETRTGNDPIMTG